MTLYQWTARWQIPMHAMKELNDLFGLSGTNVIEPVRGKSEAAVQSIVRLEAAKKGIRLWRNNVGAGYMQDGSFIRFGLANDSPAINCVLKSADLIGIEPVLITPAHVGQTIGRFISREVKAYGWRYTATERERAQLQWAELINANGGNAAFVTGEGSL